MIEDKKIKFHFDNHDYEALTQKIGSSVWVYFQGKTYSLPVTEQNLKSRHKSKNANPGLTAILSPMPGKITKVLLSDGQNAEVGQVVIVMEAMKMEYTLKSELKAKIKKVMTKVGDQVALGQILIEFESSSNKSEEKK